jgi:hypothetical protein
MPAAASVACGQGLAHHLVDPAEQRLVLELLVAEPHQRLERDLVAEPVLTADLEHLGVDEALDQAEQVGVGPALHLAHEALLGRAEEEQLVDQRQPVGQELVRGVEPAAADDIGVDVPADPLGVVDAARITV